MRREYLIMDLLTILVTFELLINPKKVNMEFLNINSRDSNYKTI